MAKVGVLIPVYNDTEALTGTLESAERETPDLTVIVDDGSVVPVAAAVEVNARRRILRLPRNEGIARALNVGMAYLAEQGVEYVARLDAGDEIIPGRLEAQVKALEKDPQIAIVGGHVEFRDPETGFRYVHQVPVGAKRVTKSLAHRVALIHPAIMMRLKSVLELGGYAAEWNLVEDYELYLRVARRYLLDNIDRVVTRVAIRKGVSHRRYRAQLLQRLQLQVRSFRQAEAGFRQAGASLYGVAKTAALLLMPQELGAKAIRWARRAR